MILQTRLFISIILLQYIYIYITKCQKYESKTQSNKQNLNQQLKYLVNEQILARVIKIQQSYAILQLYKCSYGFGIVINITHYIDIIIISSLYVQNISKFEKQILQISWEAIPGQSTNALKKILNVDLNLQKQYTQNIYDALFQQQSILKMLKLQAKSVLGTAGWKQKTGWGFQTFIKTQYIPYFNLKYVKNIKQIQLFTDLLGLILSQQAVAYHLPKYKGMISMKNGIQFNMNTNLNIQQADEIYKLLCKTLGNSYSPPIFKQNGFKILHFPQQKYQLQSTIDPLQKQYYLYVLKNKNLQFLGSVINILSKSHRFIDKVVDQTGKLRIKMFQSLGQLRQNNWNKCDNDYRQRIQQNLNNSLEKYNGILQYVQCLLGPKIQEINQKYSQIHKLGQPISFCQKQVREKQCKIFRRNQQYF